MVKGVHNKIIEIHETGNDSFERAILFVKPEKQGVDNAILHASALGYIKKLSVRKGVIPKSSISLIVLKNISILAVGAVLASIFFTMYR